MILSSRRLVFYTASIIVILLFVAMFSIAQKVEAPTLIPQPKATNSSSSTPVDTTKRPVADTPVSQATSTNIETSEDIDFINLPTVKEILTSITPPFNQGANNPTMEQYPSFTVGPFGPHRTILYPEGDTWYRETLSSEYIQQFAPEYEELIYQINRLPAEVFVDGERLTANIGERGWATADGGFVVKDNFLQYISYHTTLRPGSRFAVNAFGDGSHPLEPYYYDTWFFVGNPIPINRIKNLLQTGLRDQSSDIPIPPPYHPNEPSFRLDPDAAPEFISGGIDFSIPNFGISGIFPEHSIEATSVPNRYLSSINTNLNPNLFITNISETAIPHTSYRGSTIAIQLLTEADLITKHCSYDSVPKFTERITLGEREFALRPWQEGTTGSQYEGFLVTHYDPNHDICFVIETVTRSSEVPTAEEEIVPFQEHELDNLIFTFLNDLYFEG